jgi:hypothetical protein
MLEIDDFQVQAGQVFIAFNQEFSNNFSIVDNAVRHLTAPPFTHIGPFILISKVFRLISINWGKFIGKRLVPPGWQPAEKWHPGSKWSGGRP